MFDIDKYLGDMEIKEMDISEDILTRTKKRCEDEQRRSREEHEAMKKVKKAALIAVPITAVLLIGVFLGAWLFSTHTGLPQAVAYYTVDVNPSLRVHVDGDGSVNSVVGQNEDAEAIVGKLNCVGKNVTDAITDILAAVKDAGYFDAGQRYVLIGCFTADGTQVQGTLDDLQSRLEADFGDMIDLLIVSGSLEDMQEAYQLDVSAGLLKLSKLADGVEVKGGEKVEDVLNDVQCVNEPNYCAPEIAASVSDKINLSWDALDFDAMGYAGKVRYSIAMGDTKQEVLSGNAAKIKTFSFYGYAQPLSYSVSLAPGTTKYFALYAQYGETVKCSNAVMATMPGESLPTETTSTEPTASDEPKPTETPLAAHSVSGRISGDKILLSWSPETAGNFDGYKVVASTSNPNPKYPDDGYLKYITNPNTTGITLYEGYCGLNANTTYYFSITYLYSDGTKIAANAVKLKVPAKSAESTEEPGTGEYLSTRIRGSIDGSKIHLSWNAITREGFDGYKVMFSFSDHTPVYGDGCCSYISYISDPNDTSISFDASRLGCFDPGATCYFSITTLYEGHSIVRPGNTISLTMPSEPAEPDEPYASTNMHASLNSDGTRINFSWSGISDDRFCYYKVVGSRNPNPSYPGDGYLTYIDNPGDTNWSISVSSLIDRLGGGPGTTYYFTITTVYDCDVRKTGSDDAVTLPVIVDPTEAPTDPPPTETPTDSPSESPSGG